MYLRGIKKLFNKGKDKIGGLPSMLISEEVSLMGSVFAKPVSPNDCHVFGQLLQLSSFCN